MEFLNPWLKSKNYKFNEAKNIRILNCWIVKNLIQQTGISKLITNNFAVSITIVLYYTEIRNHLKQ